MNILLVILAVFMSLAAAYVFYLAFFADIDGILGLVGSLRKAKRNLEDKK